MNKIINLKDLKDFEFNKKLFIFDTLSKGIIVLERNDEILEYKNIKKYNHDSELKENLYNALNFYRENLYSLKKDDLKLNTLMLVISQDCNLKCTYCYANKGTYNSKNKTMSINTGKKALDFANKFGIKNIQFFGGEPLLNLDLLKELLSYSEKMNYKFNFGIITNGTLINEKIINLFKKYDLKTTISIDGPKEINDLCRIKKNNSGSYSDIVNGLNLINEKKLPLTLEIVVSKKHLKNISLKDQLEHLTKYSKNFIIGYVLPSELNIESFEEALNEDDLKKFFKDLWDYIFNKIQNKEKIINLSMYDLLENIFSNRTYQKNYICESLATRITVFTNGDIYPCQFTKNSSSNLGNINLNTFEEIIEKRDIILKQYEIKNLNVWWKNVGNICIGLLNKNNEGIYEPKYKDAYDFNYKYFLSKISEIDINSIISMWSEIS